MNFNNHNNADRDVVVYVAQLADKRQRRREGPVQLFFAGTGFDAASVRQSKDGLKDRLDWVLEAHGHVNA